MSYDFNSRPAPCDHQQTRERYFISNINRRSLRLVANPALYMRAPINGASFLKLYIGGQLVAKDHATFGYDLVRDLTRVEEGEEIFYKIVFRKPVRLIIPLIEVSYLTKQGFCLKCNALGTVNDVKKSTSGSWLRVMGRDKLVQRSLKFILTSECAFYPSFTCQIKTYIGRKFGLSVTENDISAEILRALDRMRQIQIAQKKVQLLEPTEVIKDILSVIARRDENDPTIVRVAASISSFGTQVSPLNFTLRGN